MRLVNDCTIIVDVNYWRIATWQGEDKTGTTAAIIIQSASAYGIPLSTTHVISTSIMGVGAAKRFSGVKWSVVERIIWAWIFTLPATGLLGFLLARVAEMF